MVPSDRDPAQSYSPCTATRGRPGAGEGVAGLRSSLDTIPFAYEAPSQTLDLVHGPCLSTRANTLPPPSLPDLPRSPMELLKNSDADPAP